MQRTIQMRELRRGDVVRVDFLEGLSKPMVVLRVDSVVVRPWIRFEYEYDRPRTTRVKRAIGYTPGHVDAPPDSPVRLVRRRPRRIPYRARPFVGRR